VTTIVNDLQTPAGLVEFCCCCCCLPARRRPQGLVSAVIARQHALACRPPYCYNISICVSNACIIPKRFILFIYTWNQHI